MASSKIGIFPLAMINVAAIISLKNFPVMAEFGLGLVFFFFLAALIFFVPTSLVSAELSTTYPETGGVYIWVKRAFGDRWGFVAIWLQWVENVIWYPTILSFTAGTLAYAIDPALATNKLYMTLVILSSFWVFTFLNFFGMKASGLISSLGAILGTLLPGFFILVLSALWIIQGRPIQISGNFIPDFTLDHLIFFTGIFLSLAGMEMSAVHAKEVKNPTVDYPKAILLSALIIFILSVFGALSIGIIVPKSDISLVSGIMQAFHLFFESYGFPWMTKVIAVLASVGALAMVSTWIIGPSKGLMATAHNGDLPPIFQKRNRHNMPITLMIFQALIVSALALVFLFMPTISSSYWILTALTAQLYLIMYILVFLSAIALRKKDPETKRPYKTPCMNLVGTIGILGCCFAIFMGFFPPKGFAITSVVSYIMILLGGIVVLGAAPFIILLFKKPTWIPLEDREKDGS